VAVSGATTWPVVMAGVVTPPCAGTQGSFVNGDVTLTVTALDAVSAATRAQSP